MKTITIAKDPYGTGVNMFLKGKISLKEGLTILVGCNGSGKSTMLMSIKSYLDKKGIPSVKFDNLTDGGSNAKSEACYRNDFSFLATSFYSSEGENIMLNMGRQATKIGAFVNKHPELDEYWFLFDAIDSGLSVDNVVDIKEDLFKTILEKDKRIEDKKVYIIVSANEYELCKDSDCYDVQNCEYVKFPEYESFREFILKSRKNKEIREANESIISQNQDETE